VDVKIASELLRHANVRITLDLYAHTVTSEKREASRKALQRMMGDSAELPVPPGTVSI
jgi:integrase